MLEKFYESWSNKSNKSIEYDIESAVRKAEVITSSIPAELLADIHSIMDFGCGYGAVLNQFQTNMRNTVKLAIGVDFSNKAIDVATKRFSSKSLKFYQLPHLNIALNMDLLQEIIPNGVDCILLIDLLEHVADCKQLMMSLAKFSQLFIIKLPIESSVFDNYVAPKEYPSARHSNGHLREFDVNNVYYFVRQLGITPLYESTYIYHINDTFPPTPVNITVKQRIVRWLLFNFKYIASMVLPKKLFLRWIGGGGYFCLATFDPEHILNP